MVEKYPEVICREISEGHEVGNHSYSHKYLRRVSKKEIDLEMDKADKVISAIAPAPTLFRPPGGEYNQIVIGVSNRHAYTIILWSIDTKDWRSPPIDSVVESVLKNIKPGSIILLHDGISHLPTPRATELIISRLKERGYEFVTVNQLLQYYEVRPEYSLD